MIEFDLEEIKLNNEEQANLLALSSHPGFKTIMKILKSSCDSFISNLMNVDNADQEEVISRHNSAQTAARLYTRLVDKINHEIGEYKQIPKDDKPIDITEGILDLGETYENMEDEWTV